MKIIGTTTGTTPLEEAEGVGQPVLAEAQGENEKASQTPAEMKPLAAGVHHKTPAVADKTAGAPALLKLSMQQTGEHPFVTEIRTFSQANAQRLRQENLELLAGEPDPKAALAAMESEVQGAQQILIRRSTNGLRGILRDMRMKTVYEAPGKRGGQYLTYREETERNLGYYEYRPSYGYVSVDEVTRAAATEYGEVIMTMKGAEERVTFCQFDSFDQATRENFEQNCFVWEDVAQLVINQQLTGLFRDMPFAYDEAQIFGGVNATDISELDIPEGAEYEQLIRDTKEALPWVKINRYPRKTDGP